jgi:Uma2 family endonuclease
MYFYPVIKTLEKTQLTNTNGVKVADVVWCSDTRFDQIQDQISTSIAPEICIELKSSGNTIDEMEFKKQLYLEAQAIEVWLCNEQGQIKFYNQQSELKKSLLVPGFPTQIKR